VIKDETLSLSPTATGFAAKIVVAALRNRGIDPTPLLERVGLSEQELNRGQDRISAPAQARFLELAAKTVRDPLLGFHLAQKVNPREAGVLFYVASSAKDLGEAMALFARYCRIINEAYRVHLNRGGNGLDFDFHIVGLPGRQAAQNAEFTITTVLKAMRQVTGRNVCPTTMTLAHSRNSYSTEVERFCGCLIEFDASSNRLVFSHESAATPLITRDKHLLDVLQPMCEEAAKRRETAPESLRAFVETEAQRLLPHGGVRRQDIAKNLAMSTRTLARKLANEGTSFEEVVDELRRSLALQYIETPGVSVSQIAWLLGYEGSRSFNHAFRRWTGGSPSAARAERQLPTPA